MNSKISNEVKLEKYENISKIKIFPLFLSEFSYLIIVAIISSFILIFPSYHETTKYYSNSVSSWNSSLDPLIFTHLSDIHITNFKDINHYKTLFLTEKKLKPNFNLLTGDIADNYNRPSFPKVGKQNQKDWENYKDLLDTVLNNETILDVAGNHDMFGVISPLDEEYGYLDVSKVFTRNNTKTLEDFWLKTVNIEGITFILLHPFSFPMVHPPYNFYPHPSKQFLDLLEDTINEVGPCSILTHYSVDIFGHEKNKNGNSFKDIIKNENVQYIFTGHSHPSKFMIKHHKYGGLEFIGTSMKKTNDLGLVTIDNGRLVYNRVDLDENKFQTYFMTHPTPIEQLSKSHNFNEKKTEIRVISYKNDIEDNLYISGDFNGKLEFRRILKNGAKLYSMPMNIKSDGEYEIILKTPGCEIKRKFYVGDNIELSGEQEDYYNTLSRLILPLGIIIIFFLLIITFPLKILDFSFIDNWILEKEKGKNYYWILCFFLCPFILNYRININIPIYFRIILFISCFYPLLLPFHFFAPIKGYIGYSFLCFYLIKYQIIYDEWSIFFNILYFLLIISPITLVVSVFRFRKSCFYIFQFIYLYLLFIIACVINFRFAGESVNLTLLFFHPCFVIVPIILNVLLYISLKRYNKLHPENEYEFNMDINSINNERNSILSKNSDFSNKEEFQNEIIPSEI